MPACSWCNYAKLNRTPSEWLADLAYRHVCGTLKDRSEQMVLHRLTVLVDLGLIDPIEHRKLLRATLAPIQARLAHHLP